jgi:hypothetical protein
LQICFVYDFFRSIFDNGTAARNGRWLYDLLSPELVQLGHDVRWMDASEPSIERGIAAILESAAGRHGTDAWIASFSAPETREVIAQASAPLRHFEFVIGFELSPNQIRAFSSEGIPFLDVSIDPIRFGPDIFFRMRTNDDALCRTLEAHEIGLEMLRPYASLLRSKVGRSLQRPASNAPAILFVGQTDVDASLISDARLARACGFTAELRQSLTQGQQLLLKPHPGGRAHQDILCLGAVFPDARLINDNIYALLCAPWIERVITLSSSVAQEAELFDKPATCLAQPDNTRDRIGTDLVSRDHRVGLDALHPDFWQVLRPAGSVPAAYIFYPAVAGNLRQALGETWGYTGSPEFLDRSVAAGQALSFEAGGDGLRLCAFGWSHPEPTGIWSVGPLATLLIDTEGEALDITIACAVFLSGTLHPRGMTIQTRPAAEPEQTVVFFTPFSKHIRLRLPPTRGLTEIMFTFPAGLPGGGASRDQRPLGIKLHHVVVTRRGQAAPRAMGLGGAVATVGKAARLAASVVAAAIGLS